jgi:hypothetical protein
VTELGEEHVTLAWLRPDREGAAGPLVGYRVEFRRLSLGLDNAEENEGGGQEDDWDPAHEDLLADTECKSKGF